MTTFLQRPYLFCPLREGSVKNTLDLSTWFMDGPLDWSLFRQNHQIDNFHVEDYDIKFANEFDNSTEKPSKNSSTHIRLICIYWQTYFMTVHEKSISSINLIFSIFVDKSCFGAKV